jgi:hypothetical protein
MKKKKNLHQIYYVIEGKRKARKKESQGKVLNGSNLLRILFSLPEKE